MKELDDKKIEETLKDKKYAKDNISEEELKKASLKAKFLKDLASNFVDIIGVVKDSIKGKYHINPKELAMLIAGIIYVVSPLDIIPDWIPVAGYTDDIGIIAWILRNFGNDIIKDWKKWKSTQENNADIK